MPKHVAPCDMNPDGGGLILLHRVRDEQQRLAGLQPIDDDRPGSENAAVHVRPETRFPGGIGWRQRCVPASNV
jgi:hypothetical protein